MTTVAKVALNVVPDLSDFGKELSNGVARSGGQAAGAAENEGRKVGRSFGSSASHGAKQESERGFAEAGHKAGEKFGETAKESMSHLKGALLGGVGVVGLGELGASSIEAADQLELSNQKIESVFGESSETVREWAKGLAASYGVSQTEAEKTAGVFGGMLAPLHKGGEETAKMSEKLTTLAQDIAKANGADPTVVTGALQKGLRGAGNALRQYGIDLTSTTLKGYANAHGMVSMVVNADAVKQAHSKLAIATENLRAVDSKSTSTLVQRQKAQAGVEAAQIALTKATAGHAAPMTAAQKAEAAYALLLRQTTKDQGATGRASDTLAQRKRVLTAEVTNLKATLGTQLMPILADVAGYLIRDVIPAVTDLGHWIKQNSDWLVPLVEILGGAFAAYKLVSGVTDAAQKVMKLFGLGAVEATVATEGQTTAQEGLNVAMEANPIGLVVAALTALAVGFMLAWQHSATFRSIVTGAFDAVKTAVLAVIDWFRHDFVDFFTQTIPHAFHVVVSGLTSAWHSVVGFLKTWGPVALAVLVPFIGIPLLIWQHFGAIKGWIASVFSSVVDTIHHWIDEAVDFIGGLPGRLSSLASKMLDAGGHLMQSFLNGLANAAGAVGDVARNIVNDVIGFINSQVIDPIRNFSFTIGALGFHHTFQPFGSLPEIPRLATGGMTDGLTAAILGDNRSGREAVLPLDSPKTIAALSTALGAAGASARGTGSHITGELHIAPDSQGRLRAWVRDVVLDESAHRSTISRMRVGA